MFLFGLLVGMGGGGAAVWYGKDTLTKMFVGAQAFEANLQAKVDALKSATPPKT